MSVFDITDAASDDAKANDSFAAQPAAGSVIFCMKVMSVDVGMHHKACAKPFPRLAWG